MPTQLNCRAPCEHATHPDRLAVVPLGVCAGLIVTAYRGSPDRKGAPRPAATAGAGELLHRGRDRALQVANRCARPDVASASAA